MEENLLKTTERNFTIEDLHRKKERKEELEKKDKEITFELMDIVERD